MDTSAIDKIISQLAMRDYLAYNPRKKDGKPKYKKYRPYSLSPETQEARHVKELYLGGEISEESYKSYCLRWNLMNLEKENNVM